jgi:hypothetical protein
MPHRALSPSSDDVLAGPDRIIPGVDRIPVQDVPPAGQVVVAAIVVLEIIGVLPKIVAEHGATVFQQRAVLVGPGNDLQRAAGEGRHHEDPP